MFAWRNLKCSPVSLISVGLLSRSLVTSTQHSTRGRPLTPGVVPLTMNRTPVRDARDVPCVTAQPRLSPELSLESRNTSQLSILAGTPPTHPTAATTAARDYAGLSPSQMFNCWLRSAAQVPRDKLITLLYLVLLLGWSVYLAVPVCLDQVVAAQ